MDSAASFGVSKISEVLSNPQLTSKDVKTNYIQSEEENVFFPKLTLAQMYNSARLQSLTLSTSLYYTFCNSREKKFDFGFMPSYTILSILLE